MKRYTTLLCLLFLALLPFVLFWDIATFKEIPAAADILDYNYPMQDLVARQISHGILPLWNDLLSSGTPLLAQGQVGALYPVNLLFVILPSWAAMSYVLLVQYSLAGMGAFLYGRALKFHHIGAVVTGVTYMLCGFLTGHMGHLTIVRTTCWLPLILLAIERWRQKRDPRYIALGGLALGLMMLAGHPQVPVFSSIIAAAYAAFSTIFVRRGSRLRYVAGSVSMLILGFLLAAPQLLTLTETAINSLRHDVTYEYFAEWSLNPIGVPLALLFPRLLRANVNVAEISGYVGILPLFLAIFAVFRWKDQFRAFWSIVAVLALVLIIGRYNPLYRVMYYIPIYRSFRIPPRNWFEFDFAVAVLAGGGLSALIQEAGQRRTKVFWTVGAAVLALLAIATVVGVQWILPRLPSVAPGVYFRIRMVSGDIRLQDAAIEIPLTIFACSAGGALLLAWCGRRWYMLPLLVLIITGDMFFAFSDHAFAIHSVHIPVEDVFPTLPPQSVEFLRQDRSEYRILTYTPTHKHSIAERLSLLYPNLNVLYGVSSANNFDPLFSHRYHMFSETTLGGEGALIQGRILDPHHNTILSLLNVKYILVPTHNDPPWILTTVTDGIVFDQAYPGFTLGPETLNQVTLTLPKYPMTGLAIVIGEESAVLPSQVWGTITVTDQAGRAYTHDLVSPNAPAKELPVRINLSAEPFVPTVAVLERKEVVGPVHLNKLSSYNTANGSSCPVAITQSYLNYLDNVPDLYTLAYSDQYVRIYKNRKALPRAFLVPQVWQVTRPEEADKIILDGLLPDGSEFDPRSAALVESSEAINLPTGNLEGGVTIISMRTGRIVLEVSANRDSFLVYSENYFPGWRATLDGKRVPIYRTNGTLRGVIVPAGQHQVTYSYTPLSFWAGVVLSVLSTTCMIALVATGSIRQRRANGMIA